MASDRPPNSAATSAVSNACASSRRRPAFGSRRPKGRFVKRQSRYTILSFARTMRRTCSFVRPTRPLNGIRALSLEPIGLGIELDGTRHRFVAEYVSVVLVHIPRFAVPCAQATRPRPNHYECTLDRPAALPDHRPDRGARF